MEKLITKLLFKPLLILHLLILTSSFNSQEFFVGYNAANYYRGFKSLQTEAFNFNYDASELIKPLEVGQLMSGLEFGFGGVYKALRFDMGFRRHKMKLTGERVTLRGENEYKEIKINNNSFNLGVTVGRDEVRIGYELEFGVLKRKDKEMQDGSWIKNRQTAFAPSLNLIAQFTIPVHDEDFFIIIKPYWRMTSNIIKQYYRPRQDYEYFNLQSVGLSVVLSIETNM